MLHWKDFLMGLLVGIIIWNYKNKCIISTKSKKLLDSIITKLLRQCARWTIAAEQDENVIIALLHANYGAAYLWATKDIATSEQIYDATTLKLLNIEKYVQKVQDIVTRKAVKKCPSYGGRTNFMTILAGK